jgi:hypothetical protein
MWNTQQGVASKTYEYAHCRATDRSQLLYSLQCGLQARRASVWHLYGKAGRSALHPGHWQGRAQVLHPGYCRLIAELSVVRAFSSPSTLRATDKTVTFEPLENGQYCTDVRIIGGRLFSAGPLCDSIMVRHATLYPALCLAA